MQILAVLIFALTYLGMAFGRVRGLRVDRSWMALAAAVVLIAAGAIGGELSLHAALAHLDAGALILLFALMLLSAQVGASGLYERLHLRLRDGAHRPEALLAGTVLAGGALSALLINDIVVFALAPLLCQALPARGLDARPYLIALALSANAGSAATLIGNPQNIVIGQAGALDFWSYTGFALLPSLLSLVVVFLGVWLTWRQRWRIAPVAAEPSTPLPGTTGSRPWKALLALVALLALFATPLPREVSALAVASLVLVSRRTESRALVQQVDWNLLLLFAGLFIVTGVAAQTPLLREGFALLPRQWIDQPAALAGLALIGSNLIGNVPLTLLFLQAWPEASPHTLRGLALLSTLAGNALLIGSVVNLIVAERARAHGVHLGFGEFARVGVPVTLTTMLIAALWWAIIGA